MDARCEVLLVEDHTLFRDGLRVLLSRESDIEIVGEAGNGREALRLAGTLSPQLILIDLMMPGINGIEAITAIKRRYPKVRVLVLTLHQEDEYIHESFRAGADGYLLKGATSDELRVAIRSVLNGKTYLSPDISDKVIAGYFGGHNSTGAASGFDKVTYRERQVLKLIAEGQSSGYIANYLCISSKTVEKHRSNLMKKLNLHNVPLLTAFAIEKGLATPEFALGARMNEGTAFHQAQKRGAFN